MHLSPRRRSPASLARLTVLALAMTACADPADPLATGGTPRPVFQVGNDLADPVQASFGTGLETAAGRDSRISVNGIPAFVLTPNVRWHSPVGATKWIGPAANSSTNYTTPVQNDVYATTFFLPLGATNPVLNFQLWADNAATIRVNGVQVGQQLPQADDYAHYGCTDPVPADTCGSFATTPYLYTTSGEPVVWNHGGMNTVQVVVFNAEFKQSCQNVPVVTPECKSAAGLDFLAALHYGPPCDFMTFGRLVTEHGGEKVVVSGNAGGNQPGGGILGEMEIDVGKTKYHVHDIASYDAIAAGPLSGAAFPNARVITGTAKNGEHVELRLYDGGEPGRDDDRIYLNIGHGDIVIGAKLIDQGNVQYHASCRGPK